MFYFIVIFTQFTYALNYDTKHDSEPIVTMFSLDNLLYKKYYYYLFHINICI